MNKNDQIPGWLIVLGIGALAVWLGNSEKEPQPKRKPLDLEGRFDELMGPSYLDSMNARKAARAAKATK